MTDQPDDAAFDRWQRVKEVFSQALEREPAERAAFLDAACGMGDAAERREVEALLAAHQESDSFLETPPAAPGAPPIPSHSELAEGQTLGPYRVLRPLGRGGMATVYLARDERHRRSVALKVLHPELAYALGPERFLREIEVAANLSHPHILPLHDSGEAAGLLYYVMPYVEGESLRDRLTRETQLPVDQALQLAREVADALAYAHGQGVIHRDIKPENILLSGGHALVADFGIARVLEQAGSVRLTETGMAVGTAAYMSPEQASGERQLDGRSDVYSLGCVLYEMLAGEPPFTGPTPQAIIARRLSENPRALHLTRETVPETIEHAVAKALAKSPADRFATAAELVQSLDAITRNPTPLARARAPSSPATSVSASGRRRALIGVGLISLLGLGVLFASRMGTSTDRTAAGETARPTPRLAVLPFENFGDTSTAYFADGITDEVRGKLASLPGLQVIARASSNEYRGHGKPLQQVARELGVEYVLTATVRWDKGATGTSRVRVTPELVQATEQDHPATAKWQQAFAAELTDVFQVQADIAGQVAQALNLELGAGERAQLVERPTESVAAYEAYLRGNAASAGLAADDPQSLRRAIRHYERAIALDSTFAPAWAGLAEVQGLLFISFPGSNIETATRTAAERAVALAPNLPQARRALGIYYVTVAKDPQRGAEQIALGLRVAPNDPELLTAAAQVGWALGRWEESLPQLRRATVLDPRSENTTQKLGQGLLWLRRYPEARDALERALALKPDNPATLQLRAMVELGRGDLPAARAVLRSAPPQVDTSLAASMAVFWDVGWALPDAGQRMLLASTPEVFGDDQLGWALVLAQLYLLRGDTALARAYADSAQAVAEEALRTLPDDAVLHALRGVALATVGRRDEAVKEGRRGVALLPIAKEAYYGPYLQHLLARIYVLGGEPEKALDQLEPLLKIPYYLSPGWLKIDPTFAPLRGNRRFERLLEGKT